MRTFEIDYMVDGRFLSERIAAESGNAARAECDRRHRAIGKPVMIFCVLAVVEA